MADPLPHPKYQMVRDGRGSYRFRLTAPNGEALFLSESYATRAGCRRGIEAVRRHAPDAAIEDLAGSDGGAR